MVEYHTMAESLEDAFNILLKRFEGDDYHTQNVKWFKSNPDKIEVKVSDEVVKNGIKLNL